MATIRRRRHWQSCYWSQYRDYRFGPRRRRELEKLTNITDDDFYFRLRSAINQYLDEIETSRVVPTVAERRAGLQLLQNDLADWHNQQDCSKKEKAKDKFMSDLITSDAFSLQTVQIGLRFSGACDLEETLKLGRHFLSAQRGASLPSAGRLSGSFSEKDFKAIERGIHWAAKHYDDMVRDPDTEAIRLRGPAKKLDAKKQLYRRMLMLSIARALREKGVKITSYCPAMFEQLRSSRGAIFDQTIMFLLRIPALGLKNITTRLRAEDQLWVTNRLKKEGFVE